MEMFAYLYRPEKVKYLSTLIIMPALRTVRSNLSRIAGLLKDRISVRGEYTLGRRAP